MQHVNECCIHCKQVNWAIFDLLQIQWDNLVNKIWCTRHNISNGILRVSEAFKTLRDKFKTLDGLSDSINLSTFAARKFKETSLYVHQKSSAILSAIRSKYDAYHVIFVRYLLKNLKYCGGLRKLNLLTNADFILYLRPYISDFLPLLYDGRCVLSTAAQQLLRPLAEHEQLQFELMTYSFISSNLSIPLTHLSGESSVASLNGALCKSIKDIKTKLSTFTIFLSLFGFYPLIDYFHAIHIPNTDIIYNKNMNVSKLNIKVYVQKTYALPGDTLIKGNPRIGQIDLFRIKEGYEINKKLILLYCYDRYLTAKQITWRRRDSWQCEYDMKCLSWNSTRKLYKDYHKRHFINCSNNQYKNTDINVDDYAAKCFDDTYHTTFYIYIDESELYIFFTFN